MDANILELTQSVTVAQEMLASVKARQVSAQLSAKAADQRSDFAKAALDAFDQEMFRPETWGRMADIMRGISQSYLHDAIRMAKLMERAFNYETDGNLATIKNDYGYAMGGSGASNPGRLLGGDSLLADIDAFTFRAVTGRIKKSSRIKDVISVATDFPAQFEAFRRTGVLALETDLYEFDRRHPGFYNQRIEAVELQFAGLLPAGGVEGTLSCGGVTRYRTRANGTNKRVHQVDTMALSDFTVREDGFLYTVETGVRGLFQGMGVGASWRLQLPRRSNDLDYRQIFDVNIVIYYTAIFDDLLSKAILNTPRRPGELAEQRTFDLRFAVPEAWYALYRSNSVQFTLDAAQLPKNQQDFALTGLNLRVVTRDGVSSADIELKVTGPGASTATATTDANGVVALTSLASGTPIGQWTIELLGGASLLDGAVIKSERVYNIQFGLEYDFTFISEGE